MILKYGLNLNSKKKPKKPAAAPNVFDQLKPTDETERTVASQIAIQSKRQKQKAEQEKLKLLAQDPNVYAFDDIYESMAEKKRGQIAAKLSADADRKPKYFDKLAKRVEERKREQGVVYQRNIVKERIAEDQMFSQTEAFITSSYKEQMIKDKAWQTQQDVIDRRNKGPTAAGMAGGFLAHLLNEPSASPPPATSTELESVTPSHEPAVVVEDKKLEHLTDEKAVKKESTELISDEKATSPSKQSESRGPSLIGVKRKLQPQLEAESTKEESAKERSDVRPILEARAPSPPRPSKEELAAAARERYLKRKAQRQNAADVP